jgi:threonine synthase
VTEPVRESASRLVCAGCGAAPDPTEPYPFRCPNTAAGDVDHVLVRHLDPSQVRFPEDHFGEGEPFVRYRRLLHSHHRATAGGLTDEDVIELVTSIDDAVARVAGHGFMTTPFGRSELLSDQLGFSGAGGVWVKDETGNVAGSHKGRHLMGVLLHLEVAERLGLADPQARPDLAVASCGNAALAAAVLARAVDRHLRVYVPVAADPVIVRELRDLGADVVSCPRAPGVPGDPAYARLRADVAAGALPFTCQGSENGLVIEGGETLGYEMVTVLRDAGAELDHLVVQVGGGALASACIAAFREAVDLGALARGPRVHTVQTVGGHPLERAYRLVRRGLPASPTTSEVDEVLRAAAARRSAFMWPWEEEPVSLAEGILDDETYDWRAVVGGMLTSGGQPVVVSEALVARAHDLGHAAGYHVSATGSAGLAGLLDLVDSGAVAPDDRVAVLFTGVDR